MNWLVLSLFLYFPEDKSEYLPAALWLIGFTILALLTMKFIIRHSKKEAEKAREYEEALQQQMAESENK
jgi:flagellar biosynthesis/type III secretory pathway M-ring protein FliF/YscJ